MRLINKKYLIVLVSVLLIITSILILKQTKSNELYEVKLQNTNNKDLAVMVEQLDSSYMESNKIPQIGYLLNEEKTKCIDNSGNEVDANVTYDKGIVSISTNRTIYCYLYFDRQKTIEDLSENNKNGTNYAVEWTEEGITTSTNEKSGYVDCGLVNYNFYDTITMITRLKFHDSVGEQQPMGNWEAAGGGFTFSNNNIEFSLCIENNCYTSIVGNFPISLDRYYTLVGVYDGNEIKLYIDGIKIVSKEVSGNIVPSTMPIFLGANPNKTYVTESVSHSTFTDALVFDSALSDEEISNYFSGVIDKDIILNKYVNSESNQKLIFYYKFI